MRGQLLAPLGGCCGGDASQVPPAQRIVGTYVLDTALNQDCCCAESPSSAIPCACAAPRNQFVVPYPCHCCGADCCCCPNSPAGPEWAAAMAGGFGQLLDELARAVLATAATHEDGVSRLAEALAPATETNDFDDHYLCGSHDATEGEVIKKKLAIAAVSWMAPKSLRNSMESWRAGGLLDVVDERMLFQNRGDVENDAGARADAEAEAALAREFGLDLYSTGAGDFGGNVMAGE